MGAKGVRIPESQDDLNNFTRFLLKDIQALERMLEEDWFEKDIIRIGAEQEICLMDEHGKPAPKSMEILKALNHPSYTTELARFNLECNLQPEVLTGKCFSSFEKQLRDLMNNLTEKAEKIGVTPILTGILPSIRKFDISMENLAPIDRYYALMDAINQSRGASYELKIEGIDELNLRHITAMIESCNTSFQVHLQVTPENFVRKYNIAQALIAPCMSIACNSPTLFGKRLWAETRIALFQQSIDTRVTGDHLRYSSPRVMFGNDWCRNTILDLYKEDIVRFKTLLITDVEEDVLDLVSKGITPRLRALSIHNSTVYRWNRPCYGISPNGKPHLRIENRILPAGPSLPDEIANAAFWIGMMNAFDDIYPDVTKIMDFDDAKSNFLKASRHGLGVMFNWVNGRTVRDIDLIENELLPIAKEGLLKANVDKSDIDRFLGIIEERVKSQQTGSHWMLESFSKLTKQTTKDEATFAIVSAISRNQQQGKPVHTWELADLADIADWKPSSMLVEEFMTTDLFTLNKDDIPEFGSDMMDWQSIRYMPIENKEGELIGLISSRILLRHFTKMHKNKQSVDTVKIGDLMMKNPLVISPEANVIEAMQMMREHRIGCLPVVSKANKLVGIITEENFINISSSLLKRLDSKKRIFKDTFIETTDEKTVENS
jgi:CBS domain-containing protein/gamma-glutamylcysteine synthetase